MEILPRRFTHIARALRRCHRTVLPRNLVARLRHHMAEHEARIGCIHDRFHSGAIARFRCAGMEQRHVIARRKASIGYGAMRTQIDSNDLPNVLCRSEEHTSELQSLMRISYAVFCLKKKKKDEDQVNDIQT